ncbi:hypothetical protein Cs7R123_63340 [Catellatospora sp. TT07R-123]|uniref:aspartyl/asparaginyl beta-hydroxylase domain-containing protein n=1 Tax=Catellatospora sp. TT07R-123 TaxID=2733863 RepID=UPI001B2A5103|nr:aspartyl/asparaginyl beta-hydroxylase domain-containing protein [Catellatospora sp. TT07R-123]GHJ48992.1 hypothetical protein Cs7R123_63340 [Catellatospora sp. TT07R-123]
MEDFSGARSRVERWAQDNDVDVSDISRILVGLEASAAGEAGIAETGQNPNFGVRGLKSKPFWSRDEIPWWDSVQSSWESAWDEFRANRDLVGGGSSVKDDFLFTKGSWDTVQLVHRGVRQEAAKSFPKTMGILEGTPGGADCGMSFFSTLRPGSAIRPHTGYTNVHLRAHLVLKKADGARFRVGTEWVSWDEGGLLVFDDTFEHEAIADDTRERVVLLFDIWHPDLSPVEVRAGTEALNYLRRRSNRDKMMEHFAKK